MTVLEKALDEGTTPSPGSVTNIMLANMAQSTIKGRAAGGGTGSPEDLTPVQVRAVTEDYTTTATAAATTTLVVGSTIQQYFTGSTTQTCKLPVTSTLTLGQKFEIDNLSSGVVTVQSSGSNTLQAMAANTKLVVTCIAITGTGTSSWNWVYSALQAALPSGGAVTSVFGRAGVVAAAANDYTMPQIAITQGVDVYCNSLTGDDTTGNGKTPFSAFATIEKAQAVIDLIGDASPSKPYTIWYEGNFNIAVSPLVLKPNINLLPLYSDPYRTLDNTNTVTNIISVDSGSGSVTLHSSWDTGNNSIALGGDINATIDFDFGALSPTGNNIVYFNSFNANGAVNITGPASIISMNSNLTLLNTEACYIEAKNTNITSNFTHTAGVSDIILLDKCYLVGGSITLTCAEGNGVNTSLTSCSSKSLSITLVGGDFQNFYYDADSQPLSLTTDGYSGITPIGTAFKKTISTLIQTVANQSYPLLVKPGYPGRIDSVGQMLGSAPGVAGTYTIKIDGVDVTGLTAIVPSETASVTNASGANVFSATSVISVLPAGTTAVLDSSLTLNLTSFS